MARREPRISERGTVGTFDREHAYDVVELAAQIAARHDATAAQVALAWLLQRDAVTSLIIGALTPAQLQENLAAMNVKLTKEDLDALDSVSSRPAPYPYWHQAEYNERFR
jgi:aryl-alcohol dehydrogenase-like predicted oxidoreductase